MYTKNEKILAIGLYVLTGALLLFVIKLQSAQNVNEGGVEKKFFHPYMQSFTIFLGETLYILVYLKQRRQWRSKSPESKKPYNTTLFLLPAVADVFTSILQMTGLNFITGSTFLIFKGSAIITTMLFCKVLLKKKLQRRHYIGCSLTIVGMVVVATSSIFQPPTQHPNNQQIGYILMLISIIFNGFFYAYQQYLLTHYHINFYQMVASEGMYGAGIILGLIVGLSFVPCSFGDRVCVYDHEGKGFFQVPSMYLTELSQNPLLIGMTILCVFLIGIFILNGIKITKMFDALTKSIINISKTAFVWAIGIVITVFGRADPDFRLESLSVGVNAMKAVGFGVIICGNLVYNNLILKGYFQATSKPSLSSFSPSLNTPILTQHPPLTTPFSSSSCQPAYNEIIFSSTKQSLVQRERYMKKGNIYSTQAQYDSDSLVEDLVMVKEDQIQ